MKQEKLSERRIAPHSWLSDWVLSNEHRFDNPIDAPSTNAYGVLHGSVAYIIPAVLKDELEKAGFSYLDTMEYCRNNQFIDTGWPDEYAKFKQFNGIRKRYIWLHLADTHTPQTAQKSKFCPLRSKSDILHECRKDCAWFVTPEGWEEGCCSIACVASCSNFISGDLEEIVARFHNATP